MIDTVKIFTKISESTYIKIKSSSIVKRSFNMGTGEIYYDVINDHLKGSFDSSLSIRPDFR